MVNVLVTGALGFIGSNLVNRIYQTKKWNVIGLDNLSTGSKDNQNSQCKYIIEDLLKPGLIDEILNKFNIDLVFHLAALPRIQPSFDNPLHHQENNVNSSLLLINSIRAKQKRIAVVNSSSSSIYGDPTKTPTKESALPDPLNPYALQKYCSEQYFTIYANIYNLPFVSLRYFNPYGPNSFNPLNVFNAYSSVIGIWEYNIKNNLPLKIFGNGNQSRDFIHVQDVADINIFFGEELLKKQKIPKFFNVGTGRILTLNEIISILQKKYKIDVIYKDARKGEASVTHADVTLLKTYYRNFNSIKLKDYLLGL